VSFANFDKAHFHAAAAPEELRALFKRSVSNVIIEITSHCNRVCSYCPISTVDRKSKNTVLDATVFERIIDDLRSIDYDGGICLNLYNEPMSDRKILIRRVSTCRQALPEARIYFSTNGDYLSVDYLKELVAAGLSELYVSVHAPAGKPYDDAYAITRFNDLSRRINKAIKVDTVRLGETIQGHATVFGIRINVFATNYYSLGSNRGESVAMEQTAHISRKAPCDRPFRDFTISYEGTLFPCCQMFVDTKQHKEKYSVGHISEFDTIFAAYGSKSMSEWRRSLLTFGPKEAPCSTCSEADCAGTPTDVRERKNLHRELVQLQPNQYLDPETPDMKGAYNMLHQVKRWWDAKKQR
jgi:radical SAM protein with 4Fe4S-binding SPASM domain